MGKPRMQRGLPDLPSESSDGFTSDIANLVATPFVEQDDIDVGARPAHVITVLHGIRDPGIWALDLRYHSRKNGLGVHIEPISYGWLGSFLFLSRIGARTLERRVAKEAEEIFARHPQATHSLVAHSNGTKIAARIIGR